MQLQDYVSTHPNTGILCKACNMILAIHTDASYLSEINGKSRASRHFYLTNNNDKTFNNRAILILTSIIKHVMSSASEAKLTALFYGCKQAVPLCTTRHKMGHPQHNPNPVTTGNATVHGLTMGTMTPKASKPINMCSHWLKCQHAQQQFLYLWRKGALNQVGYASKHHSPAHHQKMRSFYVMDNHNIPPLAT